VILELLAVATITKVNLEYLKKKKNVEERKEHGMQNVGFNKKTTTRLL
jgi:hypothetical protein